MQCLFVANPTGLFQRSLSPLRPFGAEVGEGFGFQDAFGEREHDAFFLVEMFPGRGDGAEQELFREFELSGFADGGKCFFDDFVLVMKRLALTDLLEAMLQWFDEQFILGLRVRRHDFLGERGEGFNFGDSLEFGDDGFDVVEQVMKHGVFGAEDVSDLHVYGVGEIICKGINLVSGIAPVVFCRRLTRDCFRQDIQPGRVVRTKTGRMMKANTRKIILPSIVLPKFSLMIVRQLSPVCRVALVRDSNFCRGTAKGRLAVEVGKSNIIRMNLIPHATRHRSLILCGSLLAASVFVVNGSEEIRSYRVPKEIPRATLPAGHSADDGHDHGHGANPHAARAKRPTPKVSYTTPEGWREAGAGDMRVAGFTISGTNGQTAQVAITPLPGMAGRESLIVNMWRQQVGLSEMSPEDATKELTAVDIGGASGKMFDMSGKSGAGVTVRIVTAMAHLGEMSWFYKLQGDDELVTAQKQNFVTFLKSVKIEESAPASALPPGHPPISGGAMPGAVTTSAPPKPRQGGPTWTVPAGWKEIDGGQFLFAKFLIAGEGDAKASVNVSSSAGDGGGLLANINRWRGQLGLGAWSEAELQKNAEDIEVNGGKATFVELSGTDASTEKPATTLGVKVVRAGSTWYYKLMGEPKLVAAQKENFLSFVKGVKY